MATEKPLESVEKITDLALAIAKKYIRKEPETVVGLAREEGEWRVTVETLERKAIPDTQDILGRYEITLNSNGELVSWKQKMIRKRADRMMPAEEEWTLTT